MKKKLRIASLIMLVVAIVFVAFAFLTMDVPIDLPRWMFGTLKVIYKIYPIVLVLLFVASFFVKDNVQEKGEGYEKDRLV